jgi:choline kinase
VNVFPYTSAAATDTVRDALVLAAGNGDRFKNGSPESKLLQPVLGQPLILRTLHTAREAGIDTFHVVLGYRARTLRALIEADVPAGAAVHFLYNPDWQLENGLSVLAARRALRDRRFALLMGDHLFDASVLSRLLRTSAQPGESLLAVDSSLADPDVAAEATKVRLSGNHITAIGKELTRYDALDTGLFVCDPSLFLALDSAVADADTTLSAGILRLAERGAMRAVDVAGAAWFDIDTVADLETAESQLTTSPREGPRRALSARWGGRAEAV